MTRKEQLVIMNNEMVMKASEWAMRLHSETNHNYGDLPYSHHLQMVVDEAFKHISHVDHVSHTVFIAAAWLHDTIEDCRVTYNDIEQNIGKGVADLVYALTNEKGRNRKERANDKYYQGIRECPNAVLLKLCDRIANVRHSIDSGSKMATMYAKENDDFVNRLVMDSNYKGIYKDVFEELESLCMCIIWKTVKLPDSVTIETK